MQKKIATAFCLAFSCLPYKSALAKTSKLAFGVDFRTTYLTNKDNVLHDYMLFRDFNGGEHLLKAKVAEALEFSKLPIITGLNLGYGINFTDKLGLLFHLGVEKGNLIVVSITNEKLAEALGVGNATLMGANKNDKQCFYLSTFSTNFDLRFKYDLLNSSLDFDDYGRNSWLISASLGFKLNWLFSRDFNHVQMGKNNNQSSNNDDTKIECGKRISSVFPGLVLGVDLVMPFNLGLGLDVSWYFTNLFCTNQDIKNSDEKWLQKHSGLQASMPNNGPTYDIRPQFFQLGLNIFYDFAPFCNNHEAPSEIDIEKW